MKKLNWFNKIAYFFNIVLVLLTLAGYLLPSMAPKLFPFLSVLTLILPTLLILNLFFVGYWAVQLKRQAFLSIVVFLIGFTFFTKFYKFSSKNEEVIDSDFTVLSYNVRLFNLFDWIPGENVADNIKKFIEEQNPDIICFQEYSKSADYELDDYKFRHIIMHGNKIKTGQAIFSKYRIIDEGEIALPSSDNNVVYADIVKGEDTIRVYSIHLQSVNISPDINEIDESKSKMILNRLSEAFKAQQIQSELIQAHMQDFKGHKIICGDMNNTAFSYVYKNIIGDMNDAFVEAGKGFILVDDVFEVKEFTTFKDFKNSDHFPIMARLNFTQKEK